MSEKDPNPTVTEDPDITQDPDGTPKENPSGDTASGGAPQPPD